jgi:hypothetical protein
VPLAAERQALDGRVHRWQTTMAEIRGNVSWDQFLGIVAVCTVVGVVLGVPVYVASHWPFPRPYLPILIVVATIVSAVFAIVAAVAASIVLIFAVRRGGYQRASPVVTVVFGVACGAVAGALHPFVVIGLVVATLGHDWALAHAGLRLAALVAASGGLAGGILVRLYGNGTVSRAV